METTQISVEVPGPVRQLLSGQQGRLLLLGDGVAIPHVASGAIHGDGVVVAE